MDPGVRTRRRPAEVRALLLSAAAELFARHGYAETTTDDIAAKAGVTRSVMYRHFPTKADLLQEAVLAPFLEFMRNYRSVWDAQLGSRWDEHKLGRTMVALFYDSTRAHRDAVLGVAANQASLQVEVMREVDRLFDRFFADMLEIGENEARRLGWIPVEDVEMSIRLVLGMVASATVLDSIFMPKGRKRPSRDQVIDHITALMLHGLRLSADPTCERSSS